ncbi:107-domain-containing protein [Mucor mucedo]|uniref:107-domain-containing protein n=1 Tax=Mucor mucedo TaxID=29922 RepID=UPI00221EB5AB|nr:107-domain-containing protein [Mucor mucedo]KAI7888136.1 107-domain-containing protein [Mucor mucedo]
MADIFDQFAQILKSGSDSTALQIAKEYESLSQNGDPFLSCENHTWELLAVLASTKNKSIVHRYASIRQWVSKIPIDHVLAEKIMELEIIEQEIEEELNVIVRKNRMLRQDDERPAKRRHVDDALEQLYQARFKQLRHGDLTPAVDGQKTLDYVFNEYIHYNRIALDDDTTTSVDTKERSAWRDCVTHMAKHEGLGKYGQALYYTLCGNIKEQCELVGKTFEDVIWICMNGLVEDTMDGKTVEITDERIRIALEKDEILEKGDPRILFHRIQSSMLNGTVTHMIRTLYDGLIKNTHTADLCVNDFCRENTLRFVSTWILFGRKYFGWKEDPYSTALVAAYVQLNAQPHTFRPIVIASYAARLSLHDQILVYSNFLQEFDGDREECRVLCQLGKEVGLDMPMILIRTNNNLYEKAVAQKIPGSTTFNMRPITDTRYDMFFRALDWLLVDDELIPEAIKSANELVNYFLSQRQIQLAEKVFETIPSYLYEKLVLCWKDEAVCTFHLNQKVVNVFLEYPSWETLLSSRPKDSGSLKDLQDIYAWRDELERQTLKLEDSILDILESNWLKGVSSDVRQIYIPELIIRLHHILLATSEHISK